MKRNILIFAAALMAAFGINDGAMAQSMEALFHYQRGVDLFGEREYKAAGAEFSKAELAMGVDDGGYAVRTQYYLVVCASRSAQPGAQEGLRSFIESYPNSIYLNEIHFEMGAALEKQGDFEQAYRYFALVKPFDLSDDMRDEFFYRKGYSAYQTGNLKEAYENLRSVSSNRDYLPHATYYLAYMDYLASDLTSAKRGFSSLAINKYYEPIIPFYLLQIEFLEGNYEYVIEKGPALLSSVTEVRAREVASVVSEANFRVGNYDAALQYMDHYQSIGGEMGPEQLYIAGFCNRYQGYPAKAAGYLSQVATQESELGQNAAYHLADCYVLMGDKARALSAFGLAAKMDYNLLVKEEAMFNQGKLQYELGGGVFNEAIVILRNYMTAYPNSPRVGQARELLLAAYFNTKNYDAAYDAIKMVQNPDNSVKSALQKIVYFRGLQSFETGDYGKALLCFDEADANRFTPKYTALTMYWRGEIAVRKGDYALAARLFKEYVNRSPATEREHLIAYYNLGYCYFNTKNWAESATWFSKFIAGHKQKGAMLTDAHNRLGDIAFAQREYWKAATSYDNAIESGTAEADYARYQRAVMLGLVDRRDRKIESLQQIISSKQGEFVDDAIFELGRTYVQQERFNEGAAQLKSLVANYPQSPFYLSALSELGLIYLNLGNNDQALKYYKDVVAASPTSLQAKDAMLGIQNIYVEKNDIDSYMRFAQSSGIETNVTIVERDSLTYEAARRVFDAGNSAKALPMMDSYLRQYPRGAYRVDALYALAECSMAEGNRAAAKSAYKEVGALAANKYKSDALSKAAQMDEQDGKFAAAAESYKTLSQTATQTNIITAALTGYLKNSIATGDLAKANEAATDVLASPFVTDDIGAEANFAKARYQQEQGNAAQALALYRLAAAGDAHVRTKYGAQSMYEIAHILFQQGKLKEAEKEILAFSAKNTPHQYWLGRSFLLLGDIYVAENDNFQAKATYNSIVSGYSDKNDGVIEEAKRKIEAIK